MAKRTVCCILCTLFWLPVCAFILLVIIMGAYVGKIEAPIFSVKDVDVSRFELKNGGTTFQPTVEFSMSLRLSVESYNPNKLGIRFDKSFFNVTWQEMTLGGFSFEAFKQPSKSSAVLNTTFYVDKYDPMKAGYTLAKGVVKGDPLTLQFHGFTKASLSILILYTPKYNANVKCAYTFNTWSKDTISSTCNAGGGL